ncbi:unnamed protein product, partial [Closterium sp. NIES-53]
MPLPLALCPTHCSTSALSHSCPPSLPPLPLPLLMRPRLLSRLLRSLELGVARGAAKVQPATEAAEVAWRMAVAGEQFLVERLVQLLVAPLLQLVEVKLGFVGHLRGCQLPVQGWRSGTWLSRSTSSSSHSSHNSSKGSSRVRGTGQDFVSLRMVTPTHPAPTTFRQELAVASVATAVTHRDYTFSLGSGSVSLRSTHSSSVLSSSCEAEIYAGAMSAQELRWLTYLLTDLGERPRLPPVL